MILWYERWAFVCVSVFALVPHGFLCFFFVLSVWSSSMHKIHRTKRAKSKSKERTNKFGLFHEKNSGFSSPFYVHISYWIYWDADQINLFKILNGINFQKYTENWRPTTETYSKAIVEKTLFWITWKVGKLFFFAPLEFFSWTMWNRETGASSSKKVADAAVAVEWWCWGSMRKQHTEPTIIIIKFLIKFMSKRRHFFCWAAQSAQYK